MKELKLNILREYESLIDIEEKIYDVVHKLKVCELRYAKYTNFYSNCYGCDRDKYSNYVTKCKLEKTDLECELAILKEEYKQYKEEFESKFGEVGYETIL